MATVAGIHVDDFLIGGFRGSKIFLEAEAKLQAAYRWGKRQSKSFSFAGSDITQHDDMSISLSQESYVEKYLEECQIDKQRSEKRRTLR